MPKQRTIASYITELKKMIYERTGEDYQKWLMPQMRSTAMNLVMLDKVQEELATSKLLTLETGSNGQNKTVQNPLLVTYKDLQRTLILQLEALGLNYKVTPTKITDPTKKGGNEHDKLMELLNDSKDV